MSTYFDLFPMSFVNVRRDEEGKSVDTEDFLAASNGVVKMFELVGTGAFTLVQADVSGNISKIRKYHRKHVPETDTLEKLVLFEKKAKKRPATECLLWLLRGHEFLLVGLQRSLDDNTEKLLDSFTASYKETLMKHHNVFVRNMVPLAMKATPPRDQFFNKLGGETPELRESFQKWLDALGSITKYMLEFIERGGFGEGMEVCRDPEEDDD